MEKKKIAVLVSGGVDSSVALALLQKQGHEVTAFYLKIWLEDELSYLGECPWQQDLDFANGVCQKLSVPLQVISMQRVYYDRVIAYMLADIKAGRTPNPDVLCNQHVKFGAFYDAIDPSFDFIATGHYAEIEHISNGPILKKGKDPIKDQTYFLAYLSPTQLNRALFPIGHFHKDQVRELAAQFDLPTSGRKDSQGICFLGKVNFSDFIRAHLGNQAGDLIEFETGEKVGEHEGFWFYTIGQRQGIGLSGGPWYVVAKDTEKNIVFISKKYEEVSEYKAGMVVSHFNWINESIRNQRSEYELDVRFRHGALVHPAIVTIEQDKMRIMLKQESKQGIAVGQFAVLYEGDVCLGGGFIEQAL